MSTDIWIEEYVWTNIKRLKVTIKISKICQGHEIKKDPENIFRLIRLQAEDSNDYKTYFIGFTGSYCAPIRFINDIDENGNLQLVSYFNLSRDLYLEYDGHNNNEEYIWIDKHSRNRYARRFEYNPRGFHQYNRISENIIKENEFARKLIIEYMHNDQYLTCFIPEHISSRTFLPLDVVNRALDYLLSCKMVKEKENNHYITYSLTSQGYIDYEKRYGYYTESVFLIISCSEKMENIVNEVYRPVVEGEYGYKLRIQEKSEPEGMIHLDMYDYIKNCMFCICDLTEKRPNCFYELGYAHGNERKVIITIEESDAKNAKGDISLSFDLSPYKHTIYSNKNLKQFKEALTQRILDIKAMLK